MRPSPVLIALFATTGTVLAVSCAVAGTPGSAILPQGFASITGALFQSAENRRNRDGYRDDTFERSGSLQRVEYSGEFPMKYVALPAKSERNRDSLFLDLTAATFRVANSGNPDPTPARPCETGNLPINRIGLIIRDAPKVQIAGALFEGSVPQNSDWRSTYCNSAALIVRDSAQPIVDGIRGARVWDGIRIESTDFVIRNSWLSEVRDDSIENDHLSSGRIEDSMFDGILQGMSVRPNAKSKRGLSNGTVEISGSLFRLREFPSAEGRWSMGSLVKNDPRAPRIVLKNSIIALDSDRAPRWSDSWPITWQKLSGASNNLLLWLSDRPMPPGFALPPQGFRLITGAKARATWAEARRNWIDCHPRVRRLPGDPQSRFNACRPNSWGGYSS